ncbi:MAG: ATPase [Cupriavidus sp.]|uniref:type 4b pilus protein PilO2 n=1 Tax=Cupriavidus TaxID=106589 RepID=UPI0002A43125|nr:MULTISPECIES: type 4b pilus protein PilO2 [Cupriavidus]EKZ97093.1 ATPase [Cupriavidus sp. HMR-1]MBU66981.1 ATPase [Cupriavidus sp.]MCA3182234.1 type 4b pilus protein PilO2 [Cupriavidus sp.]MCA3193881.1 type 4b pilus protein PilO2 [Cupriavidus sp.]MCA3198310.1 type 4b pilus protein PilO2 [Cupriavidus sp.]
MIVNIHGKTLAFGMNWRTLTGNAPAPDLAAKVAKEVKAGRIWHDGAALHMGYLAPEDAQTKIKDKIYSAAVAIARIPDLLPNVLFAYRLENAGAHVGYFVCGILKGRPRVGFDRVIADEATLSEVVRDFAQKAGGSFRLAGNLPELAQLVTVTTPLSFVELHLDAIAAAADSHTALRKPSAAATKKRLAMLAIVGLLAAVGGKYGMAEYQAYQIRKNPPPPQKSPAERYAEDIMARSVAPSAKAAVAIPQFARWFAESVPVVVGGWKLATITCKTVVSPMAECEAVYSLDASKSGGGTRGATNTTFLADIPDVFANPRFGKDDNDVTVTAKVPFGPPTPLGKLLESLPTSMALRTDLGSTLQLMRPATTKAVLNEMVPFGAIPPEGLGSVPAIYRIATWEINGPLRNAGMVGAFPPNVSVSELTLTVKLDADPSINDSKFMIEAKGDAYARDGAHQ